MNNNFNQNDFERYILQRRMQDPRYQNIPLNKDIDNKNYNDDSSEDSELENQQDNVNNILRDRVKKNFLPETVINKNTLIISSLDRNIDDNTQNRFNFKVKFAPASDSYKKKFPIYENSEFFLQTEYQKNLGIQGFYRNIEEIKIKEEIGIVGYETAYRQCSQQQGNMFYDPYKPRGNLVGYNFLYESSDSNSANIQKKFNSIHSIELKKLIIPSQVQTYPYNITIYGNAWDNIPYLYVKIPELTQNYNSTTPHLREAFAVLVKDNKPNNLDINMFSYVTFIPINDNVHIYTPPMTGLNLITLELFIPPTFLYVPNSIASTMNQFGFQEALSDGFIQDNYRIDVFSEVKSVKQILITEYKQESSVSIWKRRATLSGVNQPANFLQERSIYDCPKGPLNKFSLLTFVIITDTFFSKDTYFVGSSVKLSNYVPRFSSRFANNVKDKIKENSLSYEYYIPELFYKGTPESEIWTNDEIREEAKDFLLNSIIRTINRISGFFNSDSGMPVIEIGHISKSKMDGESTSNSLRNCYEFLNNYINVKHFGLNQDKKKFCNIKNTNKNSKPYSCPCIEDDDEYMYGFCDQITSEHFGDEGITFKQTIQGFYKGIKENFRPEGRVITGTKNTSAIRSLYNFKILEKYSVPIFKNERNLLFYYFNVQNVSNVDLACEFPQIELSKNNVNKELIKNIDLKTTSLIKYYKNILSNTEKIQNLMNDDIIFSNQPDKVFTKLLNISIKNFFYEIFLDKSNLLNIIQEITDTLKNIYKNNMESVFNIDYETLKKSLDKSNINNPIKILSKKYKKTVNSDKIFKVWFEIIYYLEIIFDTLLIISEGKDNPIKDKIQDEYEDLKNIIIEEKNPEDKNCSCCNEEISCEDVCLDWFLPIKDKEGNTIRESCASRPKPFLPSNNDIEDYPGYQNNYCNGKENGNTLCKPCNKYTKGSNADGMCNVIMTAFPTIFYSEFGEFSPVGLLEDFSDKGVITSIDNINEIYKLSNLGYDPSNKQTFYKILNLTALIICKNILFNGGPLSFPEKSFSSGNIEKECKVVSITQQNTFVFELNEVVGNINKII